VKSDLSDDLLIEQEVLKLLLVQMINDFNEFKMQFPCKIKEHNEINKDFRILLLLQLKYILVGTAPIQYI